MLASFNQLSGINAISCYAPRILQGIGLQQGLALLSTVGIGIVNLIFTNRATAGINPAPDVKT